MTYEFLTRHLGKGPREYLSCQKKKKIEKPSQTHTWHARGLGFSEWLTWAKQENQRYRTNNYNKSQTSNIWVRNFPFQSQVDTKNKSDQIPVTSKLPREKSTAGIVGRIFTSTWWIPYVEFQLWTIVNLHSWNVPSISINQLSLLYSQYLYTFIFYNIIIMNEVTTVIEIDSIKVCYFQAKTSLLLIYHYFVNCIIKVLFLCILSFFLLSSCFNFSYILLIIK